MSTKLIIHKFDSDVQIETLKVTINDDEYSTTVTYVECSENDIQPKLDTPKASRLVVKLVSGDDPNYFNLDKCAKKLENTEPILHTDNAKNDSNEKKKLLQNALFDVEDINSRCRNNFNYSEMKPQKDFINNYGIENTNHSPLEYSLEKVKENNARIMENIHMLNRTLNYTKEKEIMDNFCTKSMKSFPCDVCGKCFVYETGLKRHYTIRHCLGEMSPRWQVVWTCVQCFQVWPRQDLAIKHSSFCSKKESEECIKEIKTSSLLQCEFCEKVFTSIPQLLKHSKTHITAVNYECNPCKLVFMSFMAIEKHWVLCPFLKTCYNFSLPKMLLCNVCDRKFKNFEHLYNHRYKVNHFTTKIRHIGGNTKNLNMLVYQCEICGQWFTSIPLLQNHRQNTHPRYEIAVQSAGDQHINNRL